jgi:hypothetical protein
LQGKRDFYIIAGDTNENSQDRGVSILSEWFNNRLRSDNADIQVHSFATQFDENKWYDQIWVDDRLKVQQNSFKFIPARTKGISDHDAWMLAVEFNNPPVFWRQADTILEIPQLVFQCRWQKEISVRDLTKIRTLLFKDFPIDETVDFLRKLASVEKIVLFVEVQKGTVFEKFLIDYMNVKVQCIIESRVLQKNPTLKITGYNLIDKIGLFESEIFNVSSIVSFYGIQSVLVFLPINWIKLTDLDVLSFVCDVDLTPCLCLQKLRVRAGLSDKLLTLPPTCSIVDLCKPKIADCKYAESLTVRDATISTSEYGLLNQCGKLRSLTLCNCHLEFKWLPIAMLTSLESLHLCTTIVRASQVLIFYPDMLPKGCSINIYVQEDKFSLDLRLPQEVRVLQVACNCCLNKSKE